MTELQNYRFATLNAKFILTTISDTIRLKADGELYNGGIRLTPPESTDQA